MSKRIPARLHVWDARTGALLSERIFRGNFPWQHAPIWLEDETLLSVVRRAGEGVRIEFYPWQ